MKIAICIPCHRHTEAKFTFSLAQMLLLSVPALGLANKIEVFMYRSGIEQGRTFLFKKAVAWNADYLFWLDADQTFPHHSLIRLLSHRLAAVGANYARRAEPTSPTAVRLDGTFTYTTKEKAEAGELESVAHMGLGLCLLDLRVIVPALEEHAKSVGASVFPLFMNVHGDDGDMLETEDAYFFRRLREVGLPVHVDHGLSGAVGHIHETVLTNADTIADADRFAAARSEAR